MESGKEIPEYIWINCNADEDDQPDNDSESHHQPAAPHQAETICLPPMPKPCPNPKPRQNNQRHVPDLQGTCDHTFDIVHVTQFTLVIKRLPVIEFQVSEIGNLCTIEQIIPRVP